MTRLTLASVGIRGMRPMRYLIVTTLAVIAALAVAVLARRAPTLDLSEPEGDERVVVVSSQAATGLDGQTSSALVERLQKMLLRIDRDPKDVPVLLALGDVQLRLGRVAEAKGSFDRALAVAPDSTSALYGIAECCRVTGDHPGKLAALRKLQRLRPAEAGLQKRLMAAESAAAARKTPH